MKHVNRSMAFPTTLDQSMLRQDDRISAASPSRSASEQGGLVLGIPVQNNRKTQHVQVDLMSTGSPGGMKHYQTDDFDEVVSDEESQSEEIAFSPPRPASPPKPAAPAAMPPSGPPAMAMPPSMPPAARRHMIAMFVGVSLANLSLQSSSIPKHSIHFHSQWQPKKTHHCRCLNACGEADSETKHLDGEPVFRGSEIFERGKSSFGRSVMVGHLVLCDLCGSEVGLTYQSASAKSYSKTMHDPRRSTMFFFVVGFAAIHILARSTDIQTR